MNQNYIKLHNINRNHLEKKLRKEENKQCKKLQTEVNQNTTRNYNVKIAYKKNQFYDVANSPTKHKPTNKKTKIFYKRNIFCLKQQFPVRFEPRTFAVQGNFVTYRLKGSRNAKNLKWPENAQKVPLKMSSEVTLEMSPVDKVVYGKKVSYPIAIRLLSQR